MESAAIGLIAGLFAASERLGRPLAPPPPTTAIGALLNHITGGHIMTIDAGHSSFQPMNVNFGLFPPLAGPLDGKKGFDKAQGKKRAISARAAADLQAWRAGAWPIAAE